MRIIKIKRAAFFVFGLSLFFLPGENWYLSAGLRYRPPAVMASEVFPPPAADYPVKSPFSETPSITAKAAVTIDLDSGVMMYKKNENQWLLPASTVKIMTALVALEAFEEDKIITVTKIEPNGQKMKLVEGEKITVKNLLYGLLVASANDAAEVLAANYPGGKRVFIGSMNDKARQLYLGHSYFANPTGLDSDEEGNVIPDRSYTTPIDLARLAAIALKNDIFKEIVATEKTVVTDTSGKINHPLVNLNQLLGKIKEVKGIKTGWTEDAGECLVAYIEKNGRRLVTVVLGSHQRFVDTAVLIDWLFASYSWVRLLPSI